MKPDKLTRAPSIGGRERIAVRFDPKLLARLDSIARDEGKTRAFVIQERLASALAPARTRKARHAEILG